MLGLPIRISQRPAILAGISLVLYNNWLLGLVINWPNFWHGGSISELSVKGQPAAWFFRLCDLLSGVLLLYVCRWIASLQRPGNWRHLLLIAIVILGSGNILDALIPLSCSAALDPACRQQEFSHHFKPQDILHIAESFIVILAMAGLILASLRQGSHLPHKYRRWGKVLLWAVGIIWAADTAYRLVQHQEGFGFAQRFAIIIFSLWLWLIIKSCKLKTDMKRSGIVGRQKAKGTTNG